MVSAESRSIRSEIGVVRADRLHVDWTDIHAKDGCTASNVQDDFVFEDVLVVVDRISVGAGADFIFLFNLYQFWLAPSTYHCGEPTNISSWMPGIVIGQFSCQTCL